MNIPIKIAGIGFQVPKTVITNDDLTKILDTSDEWIKTRTGIEKRHVLSGNETAVELGIEAGKKALSKSGIPASEIDYIICAASLGTHIYPSTACEIQRAIDAKNAACFDITAACSGLIYSMGIARGLIKSGMAKNILIVATDAVSRCVDWTDRASCVLFGDGAGSMMLTVSDDEQDDILAIDLKAEGHIGHHIQMATPGKNCPLVEPNDEPKMFVNMDGKEVYKYVVTKLPNYIEKLLNNMSDQIDLVCCSLPINSKLRGKTLYHPQDIAKLFCEFGYTWGKLIRRSCIERPFHPDVWYAEDFIFYIHLIKNLKCIRTLDWDGYHYRIRIGSLSAKDKCERHTEQEFIRKITFATHYQENMSLIASYDLETKKIIKNHCYYTFSLLVLLLCRLRKDHIAINKKYLRNLLKLMRSNYIDFAQVTGWKNRNVKRFSLGTTLLFFPGLGTRIADFLLK